VVLSSKLKWGPLFIVMTFWVLTFLIYIFDVYIEYPSKNEGYLLLFMCTALLAVSIGYSLGVSILPSLPPFKNTERLAKTGFYLYMMLFLPTVYVYTGGSIMDFFDLLFSPADAYAMMVEKVTGERSERVWLIVLKTLASPLIIVVIPYFCIQKFRFGNKGRYLAAVIFLYFSMSVFRGTDKEVFDTFIIVFASYLVAKPEVLQGRFLSRKFLAVAFCVLISFFLVLSIFSFRKSERLDGMNTFCYQNTTICYSTGGDGGAAEFGAKMLFSYLGQGYHGLASSVDGDFNSGYGVGHSLPLTYLAKIFFNVDGSNNLVSQLNELGWSSKGVWSTGFVWMANDVPLYFVPLIVMILGFLLGASWKASCYNLDLSAVVVFVYLFFTFIYMPGNLQIAQSGDFYIGFLVWVFIFLLRFSLPRRSYGAATAINNKV